MITIISPATTMNFDKDSNLENSSNPVFKEDVNYLISILKELNIKEISTNEEDIVRNYRIQLDVKTSSKKLKEIEKIFKEVVSSILD